MALILWWTSFSYLITLSSGMPQCQALITSYLTLGKQKVIVLASILSV